MEYAIVELQGKQFLLKPGDTFRVTGELGAVGEKISPSVLLTKDGEVAVGKPTIDTKIELTVMDHVKSKKIRVAKFRSKSRYRKVMGHRQMETLLQWETTPTKKAARKTASTSKADKKVATKKASQKTAKATSKK